MQFAQFFSATQVPVALDLAMPQATFPVPPLPGRKRRPKGIGSDKNGGEKKRIKARLGEFHPKESIVWSEIRRRFGNKLKHGELLSIAEVTSAFARVFLDRDAKRRKSVLIKWFEENWATLSPYLSYVVLEDKGKKAPDGYPPDMPLLPVMMPVGGTVGVPNVSAIQGIQGCPGVPSA